ncbi:MAG: 16S rRNA (cytidine(1402)-2'-O)-methyltransferase [Mycobacteriales bacterium]
MTLIVAATPLGNPADASPRLAEALATAGVIAAEDTRRLRRLAADLDVRPAGRVLSYYEQNERQRLPELLAALRDGATVLLVTDAGMPAVSDPGHRLVAAAVAEDLPVTALPGPSAVTTALAVSGLAVERFCFEGFPPRKPGQRDKFFAEIATEPRALVFFESPRRLADTLTALAKAFGPERKAAVCRELTKIHEEVRRGSLGELADWAAEGVLGEVTLVVEGAPGRPGGPVEAATLAAEVAEREAAGTDRKTAITEVARALGVPRRQVYEAVVTSRRERL